MTALDDAEAALLYGRCRCHGVKRGEAAASGALRRHTAEPCLAARLLRPLLEHVRERAQGHGNLFDACADLTREERVPLALVDGFLLDASRGVADSRLGLGALAQLARGDGDALEFAAASAPTLDAALTVLARHAGIVFDALELHLYVERSTALLELRYAASVSHVLRDFLLGALTQAVQRWLADVSDFEVWLAEPPQSAESAYVAAFRPASIRLGTRCDALVFPAPRLAEPLRTADAALHTVLARVLEHTRAPGLGLVPLSVRVRHVLGPRLATADGNVEGVARSLAMSARSLARKLQDEGVTFSELLENMRRERALYYVERSSLTPQEIAQRLGYSTSSAFCRAFARWYGQSALHMRRAAHASTNEP